jgi:hypothetical protein
VGKAKAFRSTGDELADYKDEIEKAVELIYLTGENEIEERYNTSWSNIDSKL